MKTIAELEARIAGLEQEIESRQAELAATTHMLQNILNTSPQAVWWKDKNLVYLGCNQRFADAAGRPSPEAVIGLTDYDFWPRELAESYRQDDFAVIASNTPRYHIIEEQRMANGEHHWIDTSKAPLYNLQGEIIGVRGVYEDITAYKLAELEREELQQGIITAQQQALKELATPIIPVMDRIIVMPLIGTIDPHRARDITRNLLQGIAQYHAKIVILDITGVPYVDTDVAAGLTKAIQAARLKGAESILTGMSDAVAETLVELNIDLNAIATLRDLQSGLIAALDRLGIQLRSK